jgi:hypothetical protein
MRLWAQNSRYPVHLMLYVCMPLGWTIGLDVHTECKVRICAASAMRQTHRPAGENTEGDPIAMGMAEDSCAYDASDGKNTGEGSSRSI